MDIEVIASTTGRIADDLMLRGIGPDQRATVMIEPAVPEDEITEPVQPWFSRSAMDILVG